MAKKRFEVPDPVVIDVPYAQLDDDRIRHAVDEEIDREKKDHSHTVENLRRTRSLVEEQLGRQLDRAAVDRQLIAHYPTVYIVHTQPGEQKKSSHDNQQFTVYVGETNNIRSRTSQHLDQDPIDREDWKAFNEAILRWRTEHGDLRHRQEKDQFLQGEGEDDFPVRQYVIGDAIFNKSLTLDVENALMGRMLAVPGVKKLNNRRKNPQGNYYTQRDFDELFTKIWASLNRHDKQLFPPEAVIRQSALFKASPFHRLTDEQQQAEAEILSLIRRALNEYSKTAIPTLIVVTGLAGTGKTVLLSDMFYELASSMKDDVTEDADEDDEYSALPAPDDNSQENTKRKSPKKIVSQGQRRRHIYFVVNHKEQVNVYTEIAKKLGLQGDKKSEECVMLPSTLIRDMPEWAPGSADRSESRFPKNAKKPAEDSLLESADVIFADEAHLLATQAEQAYAKRNRQNMLYDLLTRAKVVVAVFDSRQSLKGSQRIASDEFKVLFPDGEGKIDDEEKRGFPDIPVVRLPGLDDRKVRIRHVNLTRQMRMAADDNTIGWLDKFVGTVDVDESDNGSVTTHAEGSIGEIPNDAFADQVSSADDDLSQQDRDEPRNYDLRVYGSPVDLLNAIREKANEESGNQNNRGISRVIATYDWAYKNDDPTKKSPSDYWCVEMHRRADGRWVKGLPAGFDKSGVSAFHSHDGIFWQPWNYQIRKQDDTPWAEKPETIDEIGSTYTIQGFDLNYAGVIIGKSVGYKGTYPDGRVVFRKAESSDSDATNTRHSGEKKEIEEDYAQMNLRNQLNVLLKRGVHGLYLFALDPELQEALKQAALPNHKYVPDSTIAQTEC